MTLTIARIRRHLTGRRLLWALLGISVITFMTLALYQSAALSNLPNNGGVNGKPVRPISSGGPSGSRTKKQSRHEPSSDDGEGPEEEDDSTTNTNSNNNNDNDIDRNIKPLHTKNANKRKKEPQSTETESPSDATSAKASSSSKRPKCAKDGSIIFIRIVGNDLSGRHAANQSLTSLHFILKNEPTHPRVEKVWLFNRIFDGNVEQTLIDLVTHYGYKYIPLHFDMEEYAKRDFVYDAFQMGHSSKTDKWRTELMTAFVTGYTDQSHIWHSLGYLYSSKNRYAINNNGARNSALEYGRRKCKHWIMPWDGNAFLTQEALDGIINTLDNPKHKNKRYFYVPMHRMLTPNKDLLAAGFVPNPIDEPQVIFRNDAKEKFDESVPYGRRPKVDLFWRTGLPGPWDRWPTLPFDKPRPKVSDPDSWVANVSWVARLYSGNTKLEEGGVVVRGNARYIAIRNFLDFLDLQNVKAAVDPNKDLLSFNQQTLSYARELYRSCPDDVREGRIVTEIIKRADEALGRGPYSVMDKPTSGPSGDSHDYYHPAPYWWPNPNSPDGTPYIRKDGQRRPGTIMYEPDSNIYDRTRLQMMYDDTTTVALAWYFTGDTRYAAHGAQLVQTWFLDPATAMNPSLTWAQFTPGVLTTSGFGVIDTKDMYYFLDAVRLLVASKQLTSQQHRQFQGWVTQLTEWLMTHPRGLREMIEPNNHGTYFDLQIAALYAASNQLVKMNHVLHRSRFRLLTQFTLNGTQPHESKRTRPLHYYMFNIQAWRGIAKYASMIGIDLTSGIPGKYLLAGMDYVANTLDATKPEHEFEPHRIVPIQMWARSTGILDNQRGWTFDPRSDDTPVAMHPHSGVPPYWFFTFPHRAGLPLHDDTPIVCPA